MRPNAIFPLFILYHNLLLDYTCFYKALYSGYSKEGVVSNHPSKELNGILMPDYSCCLC